MGAGGGSQANDRRRRMVKVTEIAVVLLMLGGVCGRAQQTAQTVIISDRLIPDIHTGPFAATMIVLPKGAKVTAVDIGASESWAAAYTGDNVVRVKQQFG